jgi:hypothetical protein
MPGGRVLGTDREATLTSTQDLAACLRAQGKLAEAEPLYRAALEGRRRRLGLKQVDTISSANHLAMCVEPQKQ